MDFVELGRLRRGGGLWYTLLMSDPSTFAPTRAMIGKWSVERYIELIRKWVIGVAVVVAVLVLDQRPSGLVVGLEVVFMLFIGWLVRRRSGGRTEALTAGAMTGLALGLVASVSRFIIFPKLYWAMNVIVETLLTGFAAALLATAGAVAAGLFLSRTSTN